MKKAVLLLTAILLSSVWLNANTVAYWRFEEGTAGEQHLGVDDGYYVDSANDNNMSVWSFDGLSITNNPVSSSDVAESYVPVTDVTNLLSLSFNAASNTCISTADDADVNSHDFSSGITVECMIKVPAGGTRSILAKDGRPSGAGDPTFTIKIRTGNILQFTIFDGDGNKHDMRVGNIPVDQWCRIACVCDGTNATSYIQSDLSQSYQVAGSQWVSGGAFYSDTNKWSIGAGRWASIYPDGYISGLIDEVRISDVALDVSEFLGSGAPFPSVDIINEDATVNYDTDHYTITGSNNVNVVGNMTWLNKLTGVIGNIPATPSWTISNITLAVGANVIVVTGSNAFNSISSDSVTIIRKRNHGTETKPYTIAEARALSVGSTNFWAQGYIVGGNYDNFNSPFTNNNGICCADSADETNMNNCLQVTLNDGTGFRELWGLKNHPENIGKRIKFHGSRGDYSGKPSFENVDQIIEIYPESILAYWRFEQGTNGMRHSDELDSWYLDSSGYGNNLSAAFVDENPYSTNDLPFAIVPLTGKSNLLAASFNNMALGTYETIHNPIVPINNHYFENGFTVECMVKYFDFNFSVAVGNDARPTTAIGDPLFVLKHRNQTNNPIQLAFFDGAGAVHKIISERFINTGVWYYVAAVCNGSNAYLYIKTKEEDEYQLEAVETNNISGGPLFYQENAVWTVGRGMWGDIPTDYLNGCIDEVRICDVALDETQFLGFSEIPEPSLIISGIALALLAFRRK